LLNNEQGDTLIPFLRTKSGQQLSENEEYAIVYIQGRGQDRWPLAGPSKHIVSLKRALFPIYVVPRYDGNGYFVVDPMVPLSMTCFDDFNPALLVSQLSYLTATARSSLNLQGKAGDELFNLILGSLSDYEHLLIDFEADLASTTSKEFLNKEFVAFVEAVKPFLIGNRLSHNPYSLTTSEPIAGTYSWDEALTRVHSIEKRNSFLSDYFRRCFDSISELEERVQELETYAQTAKEALATEFETFRREKEEQIAQVIEECEQRNQTVERAYRPLLSKLEKQLKAAKETNESAQIELMPVQQVYEDMNKSIARLEEWVAHSTIARDEAARLAEEFRSKYSKLQESQTNLQSRSQRSAEEGEPIIREDTPLDAQLAYLERQALSYESKKKQLEEELARTIANLDKAKGELAKFIETYRPIKVRADEAKAFLSTKEAELETLKSKKASELEANDKAKQNSIATIKMEIQTAKATLERRLPIVDDSISHMKESLAQVKATITTSFKYAEETMKRGLDEVTITMQGGLPKTILYPCYVADLTNPDGVAIVLGGEMDDLSVSTAESLPALKPEAIDLHYSVRMTSHIATVRATGRDLFEHVEFKGRLLAGLGSLAKKNLVGRKKMFRLAKEVAVIGLD